MYSPLVEQLISALRCLPGVGPKSAQRMALYVLERDREGASRLTGALQQALEKVKRCPQCRLLTEKTLCDLCADEHRDDTLLCVAETPADVFALEQSGQYRGRYFVLLGKLSPIEGVGPKELGLDILFQRLADHNIEELIVATNLTMEGEATAHYISDKAKSIGVKVSRIAHGVPSGGELEYTDGSTIAHALVSRREI